MPVAMNDHRDPGQVALPGEGGEVVLRVKRNPRARRISLRADPRDGAVVLVLPMRASLDAGLAFARSQAAWIRARLAAAPRPLPFAPGTRLGVQGEELEIVHDAARRGPARREGALLVVGGKPEFVARRPVAGSAPSRRRRPPRSEGRCARCASPTRARAGDPARATRASACPGAS